MGKNWKGQPTHLVLKRGGTNNSSVYLVKEWAEDDVDKKVAEMDDTDDDKSDPVPVAAPTEIVDTRVWTENFDKCYFASLDNMSTFATVFRDLSHRISEYLKMLNFFKQQKQDAQAAAEIARVTGNSVAPTSSTNPTSQPPLPVVNLVPQSEDESDFEDLTIARKRKARAAPARKPKKPKNYQFLDDQVLSTEDLHALSILYTFVCETLLDPHECILFHSSSMSNELKKLHGIANFDYVRRVLQRFSVDEIDELIDEIDKMKMGSHDR